jgi:hypothetical protein
MNPILQDQVNDIIRKAGGLRPASRETGISLGTIHRITHGQPVKTSTIDTLLGRYGYTLKAVRDRKK